MDKAILNCNSSFLTNLLDLMLLVGQTSGSIFGTFVLLLSYGAYESRWAQVSSGTLESYGIWALPWGGHFLDPKLIFLILSFHLLYSCPTFFIPLPLPSLEHTIDHLIFSILFIIGKKEGATLNVLL